MSTPSTPGGNPFENMLGDLLRILSQAGPVQWDLARQMAASVASDTQPEPNVDPLERIRLEELARVAELHVVEATGLRATREAASIGIHPLTRTDWALRTLDSWRPLLESLSRSLSADPPATLDDPDAESDRLAGLLGSLGRAVGPAMLGLQFGSSVGHLARRALGQYDFPVPRAGGEELAVVPANLTGFAEDWSLPGDDVRLWVCVSEVAHHAVFGRPHVRARLEELLSGYVSGFRPDTTGLEERLAGVDLNDLGSLQAALGDPSGLVRERESPEQASTRARLEALVAAVEGYVDHVTDVVGHRLIVSFGPLTEALRRRRVERDSGERFMEQLFGLELSQACFDRGSAFVHGVLERAGDEGLARLWASERTLPTPAEIDAPGLWLERTALDDS